jgi:hypothetical protein
MNKTLSSLSRDHRRALETTVARAREAAESGAAKAVQALGVGAAAAPGHLNAEQTKLRVALRAHGRQIGDRLLPDGKAQSVDHLVVEVAYEHWHRMLFARFLAESDLLLHPDGYPVTLADCKEDAPSMQPPARSEWEAAGRYASTMLPQVFRAGSPALALELPLEAQQALEALLAGLPAEVFAGDDSLGWSYQFWQAPRKEAVQRQMKQAGTKVGADELPAVTQLFTEPYMVAFLLENSLGGWWLRRHPGKPLPVAMPYLRRLADGTPAAGTFAGWPDRLSEFKLLDPCLGSGHFLVAVLHYLVPMRMAAEGLSAKDAVDRVLAENLHGLELDPRCVEIAAFALALAAWRYPSASGKPLGHRPLPRLNIACCGVAPQGRRADWLKLAGGEARLEEGMAALYDLFQKSPELGSLLEPGVVAKGGLFDARWDELTGLLDAALGAAEGDGEAAAQTREAAIAAQGMAASTRLLSQRYQLVVTNPPYLGSGQHGPVLKDFCGDHYKNAKSDLANVFLERCLRLCSEGGTVQFVMPQNWLFLTSYKKQREQLLKIASWNVLVRLGEHGFDSADAAGAFTILLTLSRTAPSVNQRLAGLDASAGSSALEKSELLRSSSILEVKQYSQLSNPDSRIVLIERQEHRLLEFYAIGLAGILNGDSPRFQRQFWELPALGDRWVFQQGTVESARPVGGLEKIIDFDDAGGHLREDATIRREKLHDSDQRGNQAWGRWGIAISQMRSLPASRYFGQKFDSNIAVILPKDSNHIAAIWCFCCSEEFHDRVREIDQKVNVTNATLVKVPFDLERWQLVAASQYPDGLPLPFSDDPTQWVFHGHPKSAIDALQVALIRLLGYRWPTQRDATMKLSAEARALVASCGELDSLCDDDGIACLSSVRGEPALVDRLRALLAKAFGSDWSASREAQLLRDAGCDGLPLAQWLRDKFFEQHIARFHKRPFLWHIWDGHKDGFSAILNVHTLTRAKLQTLIHTYLDDWITQQRRTVDASGGQGGEALLKLAKAEALKAQLLAILEGEAPYDIFVRWKPLHLQPIGWDPDLNDGVRMNIRPFVEAGVLRLPRNKLGIKWEPDRGKDVPSAPWYKLGPRYGEPEGTRINDHHLSLAEKQAARAKVAEGRKA